ncbi:MAG: hypothetical protein RO257_13230 [Candidatus Kapabacteria bacterium]|nr:hypothetical protein [Candidatus Kapabacteria bacterium]
MELFIKNNKIWQTLLFILIYLSFHQSILIAEENQHFEIQHDKFKYSFNEPEDWLYENEEGIDDGYYIIIKKGVNQDRTSTFLNIFPYSYEIDNEDFPVMMIYTVSKISAKCLNKRTFIDTLSNKYANEFTYENTSKTSIKNNDSSRSLELLRYSGKTKSFYLTLGVIEESEYFVAFIFITKTNEEHNTYFTSYKNLIGSYRFITDSAPLDEEIDDIEVELKKLNIDLNSLRYLEYAYKKNSLSMLENFFKESSRVITPVKNEELLKKPEFEQEVYKIFKLFYNPLKLNNYSAPYWGHKEYGDKNSELYSDVKYILVQNKIIVTLNERVTKAPRKYYGYIPGDTNIYISELSKYVIEDFSPELHFDDKNIIYCSNEFLETINEFLGVSFNRGNIYELPKPKRETQERLNFLNKLVKIIPGHWGGYYIIESFPRVSKIDFNENFDKAEVYFQNGYSYFCATFKKNEGNWEIIGSGLMFVE